MSMSPVRDAVARSVAKTPASASRKKLSVVPSRSRPARAAAWTSGISVQSQASLEAEK